VQLIEGALVSITIAVANQVLNSRKAAKTEEKQAMIAARLSLPARCYKTNLSFEQTFRSLHSKWKIIFDHEHTSFQLSKFPENLVQFTAEGLVKIHSAAVENDQRILEVLAAHVTTRDALPFKWEIQDLDKKQHDTDSRRLNDAFAHVTDVYARMVADGILPPESLGGLHDNAGRDVRAEERTTAEGEIRVTVWPAGRSSGYLSMAIMNSAPVGALLTGSTDDLVFSINYYGNESWDTIAIYVPPDFTIAGADQVVSTMPHARAAVLRAPVQDRYGPRWHVVCVSTQIATDTRNRFNPLNSLKDEHYYIKLKGITAPTVAGKYFFKIVLLKSDVSHDGGEDGSSFLAEHVRVVRVIPIEDSPLILVKGEVTPATISGKIRHDGTDHSQSSQIIQAGRVFAEMTMRLDPYTGSHRSDLPHVNAVGYFTASSQGYYEVEGLAPGVYNLRASAAGYPEKVIQQVTVLRGQSSQVDGYLQPGTVIHGKVFSKRYSKDHPWPETGDVRIELFDGPTLRYIPDPSSKRVSWNPLRSDGNESHPEIWAAQSVGPLQKWIVRGGTTTPVHFEFGVKGEYGAPRDLDGMVPQVHATWINGLTSGPYYVRAWVLHYLQSGPDGSTFMEYHFDVGPGAPAGEVTISIELRT
ncbi:MAG: carboxypeptidase-like regulatory domain-containing protein, partial [Candidatus Bathyarchaeia archaeon]